MMPPENIPATPPADVGPNPDGAPKPAPLPPPDQQPLRCPRCDSPNTKFCYYNNYSLSQPRHFCKTCRRYWTKGGALRNVPIGGGCRKSKKSKSSASSRLSTETKDPTFASDTSPSLNFLHGLSPTAQFHLNGLHFSRLHSHSTTPLNQFFSFADLSSSSPSSTIPLPNSAPPLDSATNSIQTPLMDFNYPLPSIQRQELRPRNLVQTSIASSIESLSSINQDLHWKLQQQRLGMIYGGENQKEQPISYHAAESSKAEAFLGSSSGGGGGNNTSSWNEIQTWNDFHQYSALP